MAKLKVFGGWTFRNGKQVRTVVAAISQKEVANITGDSLHHIRNCWCETANKREVSDAMECPGTITIYPI